MSCAAAEQLLRVAREKSEELGCKMNIAIVDSGANLVAFLRYRIHSYCAALNCGGWTGLGWDQQISQSRRPRLPSFFR